MWLLKCFPVQATAYFRWVNAVVEASEKPLVMINMDEASVPLHLTGSVGTFFVETSNFPQKPGDRAQLGDRRNNITYIASICSDATVGQLLPQILLGNVRRFARKWTEQAVSEVSGNVLLWREQSAWNNRFLMQKYICLLADSLGDYLQTCNVILVVDMAPCHVHPAVFARARRKGIRMLLIPAGLTGVLQPLDTHVFRQFRRRLEALWLDGKRDHEDGQVSFLAWLRLLNEAIQAVVVGKDWKVACQQTGHSAGQTLVGKKLLKALAWTQCPEIAPGLPAMGQASGMFPRGWKGNVEAWVHWRPAPLFSPVLTLD